MQVNPIVDDVHDRGDAAVKELVLLVSYSLWNLFILSFWMSVFYAIELLYLQIVSG